MSQDNINIKQICEDALEKFMKNTPSITDILAVKTFIKYLQDQTEK